MRNISNVFDEVMEGYGDPFDSSVNSYKNRVGILHAQAKICECNNREIKMGFLGILTRKHELEPLKDYGFDIAFTGMNDLCFVGLAHYLGAKSHVWISTGPLHDIFSYHLGQISMFRALNF